jgi:hypothetical protein
VTWIYNFPLWFFGPVVIALACAATAAGAYIVHRFSSDRLEQSRNDVAGPVVSVAGTILAVMLSFMVVIVWEEYDTSAASVLREAGALSDLHQESDGFPFAMRLRIQSAIDRYVDTVLHIEWPQMRTGGRSGQADDLAREIENDVIDYNPTTPVQTTLQASSLDLVHNFLDSRRQRLFDNQQGISLYMWATLIFLSVVTIWLALLFRTENWRAHTIMTVALAAIVAAILVLIAELDYPFRGTLQIQPGAFIQVMHTVHRVPGSIEGNP